MSLHNEHEHEHAHICGCGHDHSHEEEHAHPHHHAHGHDEVCACPACEAVENIFDTDSAEEEKLRKNFGREIKFLVITGVIFAALMIVEEGGFELIPDLWMSAAFIILYILIGHNTLKTAFTKIIHGDFFNEFTLMSAATIAAAATGEMSESVGVMFFYRLGQAVNTMAISKSRRAIRELMALEQSTHEIEERKAATERFITRFSRIYTPAVFIIAIAALLVTKSVHRGLAILVIACPCALMISVPLGYYGGIGAASKRNILVKGADVIDSIGKTACKIIFCNKGAKSLYTVSADKKLSLVSETCSPADIEACDAVILDDLENGIKSLFSISKHTRLIVWENVCIVLAVKLIVLFSGFGGLSGLWEAVFADVGVCLLAILNSTRAMKVK